MTEAATADMFRVDSSRVGMLNPYEAVDLAARLIRSDASDSGVLEDVVIDIPLNITAPDGGVDGTATGSPRQSIRGLVKKGTTAYQFRTGTFTPNSSIASILLTKQGEVKPRIRSCIQGGGTLVVLLFGWDGTAHMDDDTLAERFRRTLEAKSGELAGAKVDVWGLNRIVDAIERFPGIAADVGGGIPAGTLAMSHREWSCTTDMAQAFKHGRAEDDVIKEIRDCLRSGGGMPVHARVSGQPGSGKTRLVLEATRADDLAPRVVYAANPDVAESVIAAHARRAGGAGSARLIVIADECDLPDQFRIWSRLRGNSKEADLVTIYNELGLDKETTTQIKVADMGDEQIAEILEGYMKDKNDRVHAWVDYCRPSPRAAHIVGHNFVTHPDRILEDPHDSGVWERYIAGREETGSREYRDRLTVLLWLSQFTRFGFDKPYERDWAQIAEIVHERHPEVPAYRFREVVRTLRSMKVLQGGSVLYITPRILHEYMWLKWWDRYGPGDVPCPPPPGVNGGPGAAGGGAAAATAVAAEGVALPSLHSRYCEMLARMKAGRRRHVPPSRCSARAGRSMAARRRGARSAQTSSRPRRM